MTIANSINAHSTGLAKYDGAGIWTSATVTQYDALIGNANNAITSIPLTAGQLVIGGTTSPAAANLSPGAGISITNANNSITINIIGMGLPWTDITGTSQALAVNNGYTADNASFTITATLPATAAYGSIIALIGKGAGGWKIAQNAGQTIHFGILDTIDGGVGTGYIASTQQYDAVYLLCTKADTDFTIFDAIGNINIGTLTFIENSGFAFILSNSIYLYGMASSSIYTVGSGNVITFAAYDWSTAQKGVGLLATAASATTGSETTTAVTPQGLSTKLGTQTLYTLPVSQGSASPFTWLGPLTNGQLLIGRSNNYPAAATLTPGTGISITNSAGGITIFSSGIDVLSIARYVYTYTGSKGTYTPAASAIYCDVEVIGGGGGGGGVASTFVGAVHYGAVSQSGGGGGYARSIFPIATIGASQSYTVGGGGAGGTAGNNSGTTGGTTFFGAAPLLYATGGTGGAGSAAQGNGWCAPGVTGGNGFLGSFTATGASSSVSIIYYHAGYYYGGIAGKGGDSVLGGGAHGTGAVGGTAPAGSDGGAYGGGGSGTGSTEAAAAAGGNGMTGVLIITEYRTT